MKCLPAYAALFGVVTARTFYSRDATVRELIANCSSSFPPLHVNKSQCQAELKCILQNVAADYSARWGAGASILAFIPTIVGLMSNSVDEIVLIAEESPTLAVLLSLCSVTAFVSRFGEGSESDRSFNIDDVINELRDQLSEAEDIDKAIVRWRRWQRVLILATALSMLSASSIAVWYSVYNIATYGTIVFSCPSRVHAPLWAALAQLLATGNVLLRRYTIQSTAISLQTSPGANRKQVRHCSCTVLEEIPQNLVFLSASSGTEPRSAMAGDHRPSQSTRHADLTRDQADDVDTEFRSLRIRHGHAGFHDHDSSLRCCPCNGPRCGECRYWENHRRLGDLAAQ